MVDNPSYSEFNWVNIDQGTSFSTNCFENPFITTWQTTTDDETITIPTFGNGYDYDIDWGDGTLEFSVDNGDKSHVYETAGTYTVSISGAFPRIYFNDSGDKDKILTIEAWGDIAWTNMSDAFEGCTNLQVNATDAPDLSGTTNISRMFSGASTLNADLNHWDVSNITAFNALFTNAINFNGNIGNWNTANVKNFVNLFNGASKFNQDISNWDTSAVANMASMFLNAADFNQPLNSWDTSSVTTMKFMFQGALEFDQTIDNWDVSKVTEMNNMFFDAKKFNQNISNWNVSKVENMSNMFRGTLAFNQPINNWDVSSLKNMQNMFNQATVFNQPLFNWNVSNVTNMGSIFNNAASFNQSLANWDISNVTNNFSDFFSNTALSTTNYDAVLRSWSQQNVTKDLNFKATGEYYCNEAEAREELINTHGWTIEDSGTFVNCPDNTGSFITTWKTDNAIDGVTNVSSDNQITYPGIGTYELLWYKLDDHSVFGTTAATNEILLTFPEAGTYVIEASGGLEQFYLNNGTDDIKLIDINQWGSIQWTSMESAFASSTQLTSYSAQDTPDLSGVTNMDNMFYQSALANADLSSWDVSNVTSMNRVFIESKFTGDVSTWDVSNVKNMEGLFGSCDFNQDISTWNVSNVENMSYMFFDNTAFNQDISNWDVSQVTDMSGLFSEAPDFNQDISNWNVSNVEDMSYMFSETHDFNQDISNWNVSAVENMSYMFSSARGFNQDIGNWDIDQVTNMSQILNNTGLSVANYDATLIGWAAQNIVNGGINFNINPNGLSYCEGNTARETLISKGWGFTGDNLSTVYCSVNAFITTWKTNNPGTSNNNQITIPATGTYDVYWYEKDNDSVNGTATATDETTLTFPSAGTYVIEISGGLEQIRFNHEGDVLKIIDINQWGPITWTSMNNAFYGATNLNSYSAEDVPDLSNVTDMSGMFRDTPFNGIVNNWDVSNVTNMSYLFAEGFNLGFNQSLDNWNVSSVENMSFMFSEAFNFDQNLSSWDIDQVLNMNQMLNSTNLSTTNYDALLNSWASQNIVNGGNNFDLAPTGLSYCSAEVYRAFLISKGWTFSGDSLQTDCNEFAFETIWQTNAEGGTSEDNQIIIPGVGNYIVTWEEVTNASNTGIIIAENETLVTFPSEGSYKISISGNLSSINFNATNDATKLLEITQWGSIAWTTMQDAFSGCTNMQLTTTDEPNLSNVTNLDAMFSNCENFNADISNWNVTSVTSMISTFENALLFDQSLADWNVENVTDMSTIFSGISLSTQNYDAIIIGWSALENLQSNVIFDAGNSQYCSAEIELFDILITQKQWTITDGGFDISPPTALCKNITISLHNTGNVSIQAADIDDGSFSNCGPVELDIDKEIFTCDDLGENIVELRVEDEKGAVSTCTTTVTVVATSTSVPVVQVYNQEVILDEEGKATLTAEELLRTNGFFAVTNEVNASTSISMAYFNYDKASGTTTLNTEYDLSEVLNENVNIYAIDGNPTNGEIYVIAASELLPAFRFIYKIEYSPLGQLAEEVTQIISTTGKTRAIDLTFDAQGNLYVLFADGNIEIYDFDSDTFHHFTANFFVEPGDSAKAEGITYDYDNDRLLYVRNSDPVELFSISLPNGMVTKEFDFSHDLGNGACAAQAIEYNGNNKLIVSATEVSGVLCDGIYEVDLTTKTTQTLLAPTGSLNQIKDILLPYYGNACGAYTATMDTATFNCANVDIDNEVNIVITDALGSSNTFTANIIVVPNDNAPCGVSVSPKIMLQGAALNPIPDEATLMRDDLRISNLLPTSSPYEDGLEIIPTTFDKEGETAIVDWVVVELRDPIDPTIIIESQSALLQRNGTIINMLDLPITFNVLSGNYHIGIRHRNHLGIISNTPLSFSDIPINLDFTLSPDTVLGGENAIIQLINGAYAMYAGDVDSNGQIQLIDATSFLPVIGNSNYTNEDIDMNGEVQNIDLFNLIFPNIGLGQQF